MRTHEEQMAERRLWIRRVYRATYDRGGCGTPIYKEQQ